MTQGINLQSVNTPNVTANQQNIFQKAKSKAVEFKDSFEKSDENTKAKVNTALAGGSIAGTLMTMLGARVSKKTIDTAKKGAEEGAKKAAEGAKNVVKKQNTPLKWLGALVAIASSAGIIALNFKTKNQEENTAVTTTPNTEQTVQEAAEAQVSQNIEPAMQEEAQTEQKPATEQAETK